MIAHVVFVESVAESFEVFWFEAAGVFGDFIKIGICAPLADFMADDRDLAGSDVIAVIGASFGRLSVDPGVQTATPALNARVGGDVKLIFPKLRLACSAGIKTPRVLDFEMANPSGEVGVAFVPCGLIAVGHQNKARVISIRFENAFGFGVNLGVDRLAIADRGGLIGPRTSFHVEIKSQFVGRHKSGFGRTPGMKAYQIKPMRLGYADNAFPRFQIGGWMPGFGKNAALQRAAEKSFAPVDQELRALSGNFAQAKGGVLAVNIIKAIGAAAQFGSNFIERGGELIPSLRGASQRNFQRFR